MKQYRFNSGDFVPKEQVPDAVLSDDDLRNLQTLAGIRPVDVQLPENTSNMSHTAQEKADIMRRDNIQPGTDPWFRLWFSRPYWFKELHW